MANTTSPIHQLSLTPSPRRPPLQFCGALPNEAQVTAQGGTASNIVKDPTAGSYEAIVAGNAAAIGYLRCKDIDDNVVYIVTAKPA